MSALCGAIQVPRIRSAGFQSRRARRSIRGIGIPRSHDAALPRCPGMYTRTETAVLECRSRAQALDWSLVLISQGIESVIGQRAEDRAWFLEVAEVDLVRA